MNCCIRASTVLGGNLDLGVSFKRSSNTLRCPAGGSQARRVSSVDRSALLVHAST